MASRILFLAHALPRVLSLLSRLGLTCMKQTRMADSALDVVQSLKSLDIHTHGFEAKWEYEILRLNSCRFIRSKVRSYIFCATGLLRSGSRMG